MKILILLLTVCSIAVSTNVGQERANDQTSAGPAVIKAVAPAAYPAIALAANAKGIVIVEVNIDPAGRVSTAKMIQGHALLAKVAADAAKQWQFGATPQDSAPRTAKLIFDFQVAAKKEDAQVAFKPPFEITYRIPPPEIVNSVNY
jgi:TonB family protein